MSHQADHAVKSSISPLSPRLPDLVGESLVNQQGFNVNFGERGQGMACLPGHVSP